MKRRTLILAGLIIALSLHAQSEYYGGLGFHIGYASPTLRINSPTATSSRTLENIRMNGMKVGFSYDASIIKGFGTTVGINYTFGTYQSKWEKPSLYTTAEHSYRDTYHGIEMFADWQYKFEIAGDTYLMLYTGPAIQVGLSLTEKEFVRDATGSTSTRTRIGYEYRDNANYEDYKRLNVTWGVGAGFQYKQFFVRGGYDFGLINPYRYDTFSALGVGVDRYTRGRFDQWQIKAGIYLWQF